MQHNEGLATTENAARSPRRVEYKSGMKVSVVIPVYNERAFIEELLLRVQAQEMSKEILVIDDGSTDGTRALLPQVA